MSSFLIEFKCEGAVNYKVLPNNSRVSVVLNSSLRLREECIFRGFVAKVPRRMCGPKGGDATLR
jgi:hypothetical protein